VGTTTLSELTTSSYGPASGTIPGTYSPPGSGQLFCFYVPYSFHVDVSTQKITGTVSGNSPFNFYIMTKPQYDALVVASPPCGSSYHALQLEYSIKSFALDWSAPYPGDYYIVLENTSKSVIFYTIQLGSIESSSSLLYSTAAATQFLTFSQQPQVSTTIVETESTSSSVGPSFVTQIAVVLAIILIVTVLLFRSRKLEIKKKEETRVY
jgi:hypothetical protein